MSIFCAGYSQQCANNMHINQDKFGSITVMNPDNSEVTLAVISDGVSLGYQGKYASYNTVLWLLKWAAQYLSSNTFNIHNIAQEIQIQMMKYNHCLNDFSDTHSDNDTCCTVCGMVTNRKHIVIFNAGDSRLYELSAYGQIRCMTKDDKAEDGYSISMHIGGKNDEEIKITFSADEFHPDSRYILCTDGFYKRFNFSDYSGMLYNCKNSEQVSNLFRSIFNDLVMSGETDDITALLISGSE